PTSPAPATSPPTWSPSATAGSASSTAPAGPRRTPSLPQQRPAPVQLTPPQEARPLSDGIALVARVRRAHPELRAVLLAAADDPQRAARALQAGANGWVARGSSLGALMTVVRGVRRDETHLPPALLTGVVRELTSARRDRSESERLVAALTPREEEVLRCMVAGLGRQAVAERLFLSPHTVRTHMQNVLGKLGVHSTLAAVAVARRAGIAPSEPPVPVPPPTVAAVPGPGAG
ncbi:LuxR C-terminal-related transcriptional regulator, partial [Kitasatospora cineracea]